MAGECRRQVKNVTYFVKSVKIVEFHYHIRNRHEKCNQISTNMPSIGLVIPEKNLWNVRILRKQTQFCSVKPMPCVVSGKGHKPWYKINSCLCVTMDQKIYKICILVKPSLYFVSAQEQPWRHSTRRRINASKCISCASIPVFLFEHVRKHRNYVHDDKHLILYHTLTSQSFSRWDKV